MEIAAAILTKIIFDHNTSLRSRLVGAAGSPQTFAEIVLPIYRAILEQLCPTEPGR